MTFFFQGNKKQYTRVHGLKNILVEFIDYLVETARSKRAAPIPKVKMFAINRPTNGIDYKKRLKKIQDIHVPTKNRQS